ncbi:MAG TPA: hypothetical protein VK968_08645 [Roseimicrobium sp.]|nr:hypothetical protein [Roseimicrobium sp.]
MPTRLLLLCLSLVATLRGAEEPPKPPVSLTFSVVSWGNAISDLYYKSGGTHKKIVAPAFAPSASMQYTGPAELVFYSRQAPTSESNGSEFPAAVSTKPKPEKPREIEACRVLLPADETRATILLAPIDPGHYQGFVIPGDPTKFPFGQAKLVNLYNQPLAIKFNRSGAVLLKPNESTVVAPNADSSLLIEVAAYKGDKWKRLLDNIFTLREDEQALVILSSGDYKFFRNDMGEVAGEVQVTVLRQRKEKPASDKQGTADPSAIR